MSCHLPSAFWGYVAEEPVRVELGRGATISDLRLYLFESFGHKLKDLMETSDGEPRGLIIVNGEARPADARLADGDTLRILLPVCGGQI